MPEVSFNNLAIIMAVGFVTPLVLGFFPRVRIPAVVAEIVLGIIVGPSVLGWVQVDETVQIVSLIGLAFLLFLAGLELDLRALRGTLLRLGLIGFGLTLVLAVATGFALDLGGLVNDPLLAAVILCATSLGLVIPVLKEAGQASSKLGQLIICGASIGDFAAIILLSLLFSKDASEPSARVVLLVEYAVLVVAIALMIGLASRSTRVREVLVHLQDTTAEIRVRGAVLLVVVLVVLAEQFGLETILGAFVAGALVGLIDRDTRMTHPQFRLKLEAIGYGFLIPVFFVTSGVTFDLQALREDTSTLALVPIFLVALVIVRGVPAIVYHTLVGTRGAVAAGLLQATSLPFIVAATMIGVELGALSPATAAAFVAAGLLSALLFPAIATAVLRKGSTTTARGVGDPTNPPADIDPALSGI
jgi:Kef-type K+ transport system membrane component KefB